MTSVLSSHTDDSTSLLESIESLCCDVFSRRADDYDRHAVFAKENFTDLWHVGGLCTPVDPRWGGLGWAPDYGNVHFLWQITRMIARVDLSFARCWEGHNNALMLIDKLASPIQKQRWFREVIEKGARWAAWSGEPQTKLPGQSYHIGTHVEKHRDGYIIDGNKVFATSAPGADRAILLVSLAGPGGAREINDGEHNLLMLVCDLSDPSISFDDSWWDPIGMRSTVSYKVNFNRTFIPASECIGQVGEYLTQGMQSYFTPHYGVSFLGALDAAYEYARAAVAAQQREQDPYVQHRIGEVALSIETLELWLHRVAGALNQQDAQAIDACGRKFRYLAELSAEAGVKSCIKLCGARGLNKPSTLERIYRDLSIYVLHDNADHILATIGRNELGLDIDRSFFKLKA